MNPLKNRDAIIRTYLEDIHWLLSLRTAHAVNRAVQTVAFIQVQFGSGWWDASLARTLDAAAQIRNGAEG